VIPCRLAHSDNFMPSVYQTMIVYERV
jgi:hypothetical protein